jgi:glycosyltransferase involved in cell wall biosynthesis
MTNKLSHIYHLPQFGENWFSYPQLYSAAVKFFPSGSRFVEVGSWKGKSSSYMAVEIANSGKNIQFYCVDTWRGSVEHQQANQHELDRLYDIFCENMSPLREHHVPLRTTSLEAAKKFPDASLDFVFIDASHEYSDVLDDIKAWWPKVKPGGIMAGDDFNMSWPGVVQAVRESFDYCDIQEGCWVASKPSSKPITITAYAIAKNEEANVAQFIENAKLFDQVYVLDTGSSDATVEKLRQHNIRVFSKTYERFDFSQARNDCLDLIPENVDWCVSLDFNEKLEVDSVMLDHVKQNHLTAGLLVKCFLFNFDESRYVEIESKIKMHRRQGFSWVRPVHEELLPQEQLKGFVKSCGDLKFYKYSELSPSKLAFYKSLCLEQYDRNPNDVYYIRFLLDYGFEEQDWDNVYKYGIQYLNLTEAQSNWFRPRAFILVSQFFKQTSSLDQARDFAFHALSESLKYKTLYPFWVRDSYKNLHDLGIEIHERK